MHFELAKDQTFKRQSITVYNNFSELNCFYGGCYCLLTHIGNLLYTDVL